MFNIYICIYIYTSDQLSLKSGKIAYPPALPGPYNDWTIITVQIELSSYPNEIYVRVCNTGTGKSHQDQHELTDQSR